MNREELTIDLKDFLRRCVNKWKFIILCMLIGAIFVNGIEAWYSVKKAKQAKIEIEQQASEKDETAKLVTLKEYMSKLTEREISEVQNAIASYKIYQQEYVNGLAYCQNSVRMQLDPNKIPTLRIGYIIDNHYETTYPVIIKKDTTDAIISTLEEQVRSDEVSQKIANIIDMGDNIAYAQELISVDDDAQEQGMLIFSIVSDSKENCQKIAEIVKQTIDAQIENVRVACGDFDITLATEQYAEETDSNLIIEKQNKILALSNLKNSINNLTAGMSEEQITYYKALRDDEDNIVLENSEIEGMSEKAENQTLSAPTVIYVSSEWVLIGVLIGFFVGCVCILFKYIMANTLRVASDMEEPFGISVLGCITDKNKKKISFFKNRFDDFDEEQQVQIVVMKIKAVADKAQIKNVFIGCTGETEKMQMVCSKIVSLLEKEKIQCCLGYSLLYNVRSMEKMTETDGMVLVEEIDKSRYEEIQKVKEISEKCQVTMLGCAVIE